jgi:BCD family chlorophyll transporter-like MFS transporter
MTTGRSEGLGWIGIARLGLVQASLGAIVVLATSTMNRVMVVELAMPAMLPGFLVALHYMVQVLRPRLGYSSDVGGRRTPWVIGGMGLLALATVGAAIAIDLMADAPVLGIALAVVAFLLIGIGVGTSGTALLVLMASHVAEGRRAAAATVTWLMMIVGFIATSIVAGAFLDPFTTLRLIEVVAGVAAAAFVTTVIAVLGIERAGLATSAGQREQVPPFREALQQVWRESHSRRLALFIFISMVAYSAQDLILEPFAGLIYGMTPGETTRLSGVQNTGILVGMLSVAIICTRAARTRAGAIRAWAVGGCAGSGLALLILAVAGFVGPGWPIAASVFMLGLSNGVFAVAAIGSMMGMVGAGRRAREGVRMGLWGAAQAIAFAIGGLAATLLVDVIRFLTGSVPVAYGLVFAIEAALFFVASRLAAGIRVREGELEAAGLEGIPVAQMAR